ncbi:hypothetical protein NW755_011103, partial [Fusarium falciforme]
MAFVGDGNEINNVKVRVDEVVLVEVGSGGRATAEQVLREVDFLGSVDEIGLSRLEAQNADGKLAGRFIDRLMVIEPRDLATEVRLWDKRRVDRMEVVRGYGGLGDSGKRVWDDIK